MDLPIPIGNLKGITVPAGIALSGGTAVYLDASNEAQVMDVTDITHAGLPVFVTVGAAVEGASVGLIPEGYHEYAPGGLTARDAIYLGEDGQLALAVPNSAVFGLLLGFAVDSDTIWLDPQPVVILAQ